MTSYILEEPVTESNFDEEAYLTANPDVAAAVKAGKLKSGFKHWKKYGKNEQRIQRHDTGIIKGAKKQKLERIQPLLRKELPFIKAENGYDFLTDELRRQFNIIDTDAVSSNQYDPHVLQLIRKYEDGLLLDCGAGKRSVYFDNVVNFEIVQYNTTDVRGIGEELPFIDNSFDGVISIAVLEHVKDPFRCAKEMARVLKPGGELICCVPFLQPFHGYPHHYYNMSHQGLQNLFQEFITIDAVKVYDSIFPIWSLTWILRSWSEGLEGEAKDEFLNLKVSDLLEPAHQYLDRSFVRTLPEEKNFELASASVLFGRKK